MKFELAIPTSDNHLALSLESGDAVFILGANGTGKSSLMQRLYAEHAGHARRITAHRQNWLHSGLSTLTSRAKRDVEQSIRQDGVRPQSRWRDDHGAERTAVAIFNLIAMQTSQNREIAGAVRSGDTDSASQLAEQYQDPLDVLSRILDHSGLPIAISARATEELVATKRGSSPYSIAEMSDGERNVLFIAAEVLTAPQGTLILIDEPERHLHRSIISPLLSELFAERADCAYVLSTHDPPLVFDNASAKVLLVRDCQHNGESVVHWDVDLIEASTRDAIDDDLLRSILGARRNVLFVEGGQDSLDNALYSVVLPNTSVIPKGSFKEVEHAVRSIDGAREMHRLNAFGLIDSDNRDTSDLADLRRGNIFSIDAYSVESLYYDPLVQREAVSRLANVVDADIETALERARDEACTAFREAREALAERVAEQRVRSLLMSRAPNRKADGLPERLTFEIPVADIVTEEQQRLDDAISTADVPMLIRRYPLRTTGAPSRIAKALGFRDRWTYERSVRKLLRDDADTLRHVRGRLGGLWEAIESS